MPAGTYNDTTWFRETHVPVKVVEKLGHFTTLEEVAAKCEELWGAINRCEEEGSVPWFQVRHCQKNIGWDLVIVSTMFPSKCEGE